MLKPTVPQRFDLKTETRFKDYVLLGQQLAAVAAHQPGELLF